MDWRFASYDITDDAGAVLRSCFPNPEALPPFVKTAQHPPGGSDKQWALRYDDPLVSLRKFAMVDRGNTWLSAMYFSRTAHSLPPALRKEAAQRIIAACEQYGLEPNDTLQKLAWGEDTRVPVPKELEKLAQEQAEKRQALAYASIQTEQDPAALDPAARHEMYKQAQPGTYGLVNQETLRVGLAERLLHVPEETRPTVFASIEKVASQDGPAMVNFIRDFDIQHGLIDRWGTSLADPYATVYGTPESSEGGMVKVATQVFHLGDVVTTSEDLEKLASSALFATQFPPDFVSQFLESPVATFQCLPKGTQSELAKLAQRCK